MNKTPRVEISADGNSISGWLQETDRLTGKSMIDLQRDPKDGEWTIRRIEDLQGYDVPSALTILLTINATMVKAIQHDPDFFKSYNLSVEVD